MPRIHHKAMKIADVSTPVVVLSPHHHGALGIFRSLGALGVPVYGVGTDRFRAWLYCASRFLRGFFSSVFGFFLFSSVIFSSPNFSGFFYFCSPK